MLRAKSKRRWKRKWRWERAERKLRLMEEKLKEDVKPYDTVHYRGIVAQVQLVRTFRGEMEYFFKFGRNESDRTKLHFKPYVSEHDLDDYREALLIARGYREFDQNGHGPAHRGFANGSDGTMPSKASSSRLPSLCGQSPQRVPAGSNQKSG